MGEIYHENFESVIGQIESQKQGEKFYIGRTKDNRYYVVLSGSSKDEVKRPGIDLLSMREIKSQTEQVVKKHISQSTEQGKTSLSKSELDSFLNRMQGRIAQTHLSKWQLIAKYILGAFSKKISELKDSIGPAVKNEFLMQISNLSSVVQLVEWINSHKNQFALLPDEYKQEVRDKIKEKVQGILSTHDQELKTAGGNKRFHDLFVLFKNKDALVAICEEDDSALQDKFRLFANDVLNFFCSHQNLEAIKTMAKSREDIHDIGNLMDEVSAITNIDKSHPLAMKLYELQLRGGLLSKRKKGT